MAKLRYMCANPENCDIPGGPEHLAQININPDVPEQIGAALDVCLEKYIPTATVETDEGDIVGCLWPDGAISIFSMKGTITL